MDVRLFGLLESCVINVGLLVVSVYVWIFMVILLVGSVFCFLLNVSCQWLLVGVWNRVIMFSMVVFLFNCFFSFWCVLGVNMILLIDSRFVLRVVCLLFWLRKVLNGVCLKCWVLCRWQIFIIVVVGCLLLLVLRLVLVQSCSGMVGGVFGVVFLMLMVCNVLFIVLLRLLLVYFDKDNDIVVIIYKRV